MIQFLIASFLLSLLQILSVKYSNKVTVIFNRTRTLWSPCTSLKYMLIKYCFYVGQYLTPWVRRHELHTYTYVFRQG